MLAKKVESESFKVYCHCSYSMADINILREQAKKERQEKAAAQRASLHNNKVKNNFDDVLVSTSFFHLAFLHDFQ